MVLYDEFYFLLKVQVSDDAIEIAHSTGLPRHRHAQDIGDALEMAIRQSVDLEPLIDNLDTRPVNSTTYDLEDALLLTVISIMLEEWNGDDKIKKLADHLDTLRLLYDSIAHPS